MATKGKLTAKQLRFCREYVIDHNGTQAAIRAGYSEKTARIQAAKMLAKPSLKKEVSRLEQEITRKLDITAERVKAEIAKIAFVNTEDIVKNFDGNNLTFKSIEDIPKDVRAAIKSVKVDKDGCVTVQLWSKENALKMLAEHFNLFERHQESAATKLLIEAHKYPQNREIALAQSKELWSTNESTEKTEETN